MRSRSRLRVTLDKTDPRAFDEFLAAARQVPEVLEIQTFLGRVDVRLLLVARDMAHYQQIYRSRVLTLPHIADIEALMQVATIKIARRAAAMSYAPTPPTARCCACSPRDATLTSAELGRRLGLTQPQAWRRVKALREAGVIAGARVDLDLERLGFGVTVFLGLKLATKGRVSLEDFERAATAIPEVVSVQHVLGLYDYRLRITARDLPDFERLLRRRIMTLPGVGAVEANVLLSEERLAGPL